MYLIQITEFQRMVLLATCEAASVSAPDEIISDIGELAGLLTVVEPHVVNNFAPGAYHG